MSDRSTVNGENICTEEEERLAEVQLSLETDFFEQ